MKIHEKHNWKKYLPENLLESFGKNGAKKLRKTLETIPELKIETTVSKLTDSELEWFVPMYETRLQEKHNPSPFAVRESTLDQEYGDQFEIITLKANGDILGGLIMRKLQKTVSVYYRTFPSAWPDNIKLAASPALYVEYKLDEYVRSLGHEYLIHGFDRNPYGINSAIGVCIFKLSIGCQPYTMKKYEEQILDLDKITTDTLALIPTSPGERINEAVLFTVKENEKKYEQLAKYENTLKISTRYYGQ